MRRALDGAAGWARVMVNRQTFIHWHTTTLPTQYAEQVRSICFPVGPRRILAYWPSDVLRKVRCVFYGPQ